jgi:hypothetical protein
MCKATNGFILSDIMRDFKKNIPLRNYSDYNEERVSRGMALAYFEKRVLILKDQSYKVCFANSFSGSGARRLSS